MILDVERPEPGIALVRLNRPERLNALTLELVDAVARAFSDLAGDDSVRAVVLTGAGRGFCAGMDLVANAERPPAGADRAPSAGHAGPAGGTGPATRPTGPAAGTGPATRPAGGTEPAPGGRGPAWRLAGQERFAAMVRAIRATPQPVIAAVNGPAAGAGFGLTLACDVRVASTSAVFHVAATRIGLSAGECGISYHLPRQIGSSRAFEILLTGRPVDAAEADRIGLVSRVTPDGQVVAAALEVARATTALSPFAVRMTKRVMLTNLDLAFEAALEMENRTQVMAGYGDDAREAMTAFVEKRPPVFSGG